MNKTKLRVKSALCYTGIFSFFFLKSKNKFIRFHAKQGRALFITALLSLMVPVVGGILVMPYIFISAFIAANNAWDLKKWKIPVINKFINYEDMEVKKWLRGKRRNLQKLKLLQARKK